MALSRQRVRDVTEAGDGAEPVRIEITGELSGGFLLRQPLKVAVWQEGEEYVADAIEFGVHSFGPDASAAVEALREDLITHWQRLIQLGSGLSPRLSAERDRLSDLLAAAHA
jgi:hypothetical protein